MERTVCHICGESRFSDFVQLDHRHIVRCISCGYVFASRFSETDIARAYVKEYYTSPDDPRIGDWVSKNTGVWEGLCDTLSKYVKEPKNLLDIGSGSGGFLLAYHRRNPNVSLSAIELSDAARVSLVKRLPFVKFPAKDVAQLKEVTETYDVITLLKTLEHVYDPKSLCKDIYNRLRVGGILFVTVPNIYSYRVLLHGTQDMYTFRNVTHLQLFSKATLNQLLHTAGFKTIIRAVQFGGSNVKGMLVPLQWLIRKASISSELRYIAIKKHKI